MFMSDELDPFLENAVSGRSGFGMCRWKKLPLDVLDRERSGGGGSGRDELSGEWSESREWSGLDGREFGREPGREPGREVGFEPGGETASRLRLLSSSESIQFRWSSGCSSSIMTPPPAGDAGVVTGVIEPELRRDPSREEGCEAELVCE